MKRLLILIVASCLTGCEHDDRTPAQKAQQEKDAEYLVLYYQAAMMNVAQTNWSVTIVPRTNAPRTLYANH